MLAYDGNHDFHQSGICREWGIQPKLRRRLQETSDVGHIIILLASQRIDKGPCNTNIVRVTQNLNRTFALQQERANPSDIIITDLTFFPIYPLRKVIGKRLLDLFPSVNKFINHNFKQPINIHYVPMLGILRRTFQLLAHPSLPCRNRGLCLVIREYQRLFHYFESLSHR
jgi:hypothetical protein